MRLVVAIYIVTLTLFAGPDGQAQDSQDVSSSTVEIGEFQGNPAPDDSETYNKLTPLTLQLSQLVLLFGFLTFCLEV